MENFRQRSHIFPHYWQIRDQLARAPRATLPDPLPETGGLANHIVKKKLDGTSFGTGQAFNKDYFWDTDIFRTSFVGKRNAIACIFFLMSKMFS